MSIAISGMPASRYLAAIAGAMDSSVWNSITRSTPLADQVLGVAERDPRLVAVVDHDQLDLLALGGALQPEQHLARERAVLSLGRVADPVALAPPDLGGEPVAVAVDLLQEAAVVQRVEQPEAHALAEARAVHDVAQAQRLAAVLERPQHLRGVDERLDDVELMCGAGAR